MLIKPRRAEGLVAVFWGNAKGRVGDAFGNNVARTRFRHCLSESWHSENDGEDGPFHRSIGITGPVQQVIGKTDPKDDRGNMGISLKEARKTMPSKVEIAMPCLRGSGGFWLGAHDLK